MLALAVTSLAAAKRVTLLLPQCLQLTGATCPSPGQPNCDGIFKLDGVFADGTPYYNRISTPLYLFWQTG